MILNSLALFGPVRLRAAAFLLLLAVPLFAQINTPVPANDFKMPPPKPRLPSIILIVADNLGYGDLGCYGQTKIKTPNLDRLASEGLRFTSFYAGSPESPAARASLLTGLEPRSLGENSNQALPADAVTLASFLKGAGYQTALIGTWGLGESGDQLPDQRGFDEVAGFLTAEHSKNYYSDHLRRTPSPPEYEGSQTIWENLSGKRGQFLPDLLTTAAMNFVRMNKPETFNKHRPFFLCLSYPIAHVSAANQPPESSEYADEAWPPLERTRAALISRMDAGIGSLLKKLDELKITTNTVVIFTSLGGPQTGPAMTTNFFNSTGPFRGEQGSLQEGGLRVPLIVRWPLNVKPGGVSDLPGAAWDVFPTAAEIAFRAAPTNSTGLSFLPALVGMAQTNRHQVLSWSKGNERAVRFETWKAIRSGTNRPVELFDLKHDPAESFNVATNHPDVRARAEKLLSVSP